MSYVIDSFTNGNISFTPKFLGPPLPSVNPTFSLKGEFIDVIARVGLCITDEMSKPRESLSLFKIVDISTYLLNGCRVLYETKEEYEKEGFSAEVCMSGVDGICLMSSALIYVKSPVLSMLFYEISTQLIDTAEIIKKIYDDKWTKADLGHYALQSIKFSTIAGAFVTGSPAFTISYVAVRIIQELGRKYENYKAGADININFYLVIIIYDIARNAYILANHKPTFAKA